MFGQKKEIKVQDLNDYFEIGQKISVKRSYLEDEHVYQTYIKDISDEYILVDHLSIGTQLVSLQKDSLIDVIMSSKTGAIIGKATVYEIDRTSTINGVWLEPPKIFKSIQSRKYVRVDYPMPVKLFISDYLGEIEIIETISINLSGSGIAIKTKQKLKSGCDFKVEFVFRNVSIICSLDFIYERYDYDKNYFINGFQFSDIQEKTTKTIHKKIIELQIEQQKRRL